MIAFENEEALKRYVDKALQDQLKMITKMRSATTRRKSMAWQEWEDTYLIEGYRFHKIGVLAVVLNRAPSSVSQRLNMLRRIYGLPRKINRGGRVFTFKI